MSRIPLVAILAISTATAVALPARADSIPALSTFEFSGQCTDCTGQALGELILQNYTLGDQIGDTNFVSFSYSGTNLFSPYTIAAADQPMLFGSIDPTLPGPETVNISSAQFDFTTSTSGFWCTGVSFSCSSDFGSAHQWSAVAAANPSPVPEPMTLSLLGGGLVGLAALRRRS